MEKLKSFQPIIIVLLICLVVFQHMQINELREEIADIGYKVDSIEDKTKDYECKIEKIEKALSDMDDVFRDQEKRIKDLEIDTLFNWRR